MTHPHVAGVRWVKGRPYARMRVLGVLYSAPLGAIGTDPVLLAERRDLIAFQVRRLAERGRADVADRLATALGEATTPVALQDAVGAIDIVCEQSKDLAPGTSTVRELGEQWVSGELARRYPDHVKAKKRPSADRRILEDHVYPVIGRTPVAAVTLGDCERVMANLPKLNPHRSVPTPMAVATRRHVAQVVHRLFGLAAYPMRLIAESPLPRGFLPKLGAPKPKQYLYPDEEAKLLACTQVPLLDRILYGVLSREGMRFSEAVGLGWDDLDLERGVLRLDRNKTDDPRSWAMDPSVVAALARWKTESPGTPGPFAGVRDDKRQAARLRKHLLLAGVDRAELHETTEARVQMRAHDLRATFVTLSLATGRSETWVADRTGHKTSAMIFRYRRAARTLADIGAGALKPLLETIVWSNAGVASGQCQSGAAADGESAETADEGDATPGKVRPIRNQSHRVPEAASGTESADRSSQSRPLAPVVDGVGENLAPSDRPREAARPRGRSSLARRTISGARVEPEGGGEGG